MKKIIKPNLSDKEEVKWARLASFGALVVATFFGINPPATFIAKNSGLCFWFSSQLVLSNIINGYFFKTNE